MTLAHAVGAALVASPFVALFGFVWSQDGLVAAASVFGATALIVAIIGAGAYLLST